MYKLHKMMQTTSCLPLAQCLTSDCNIGWLCNTLNSAIVLIVVIFSHQNLELLTPASFRSFTVHMQSV